MVVVFLLSGRLLLCFFFFFNDTATTEIYTLSLHDALPISTAINICTANRSSTATPSNARFTPTMSSSRPASSDRKSTRLNSSHSQISYAVFCLKKKKRNQHHRTLMTQIEWCVINPQCQHPL